MPLNPALLTFYVPLDGIELPRLLRSPISGMGTAGAAGGRPTEGQLWPRS